MHYKYRTEGVCSRSIQFDIEGDVISHIEFEGGCNGNLKAISILLEGATVDDIESKLRGNLCATRPTSCTDQLAIAVRRAWEAEHLDGEHSHEEKDVEELGNDSLQRGNAG